MHTYIHTYIHTTESLSFIYVHTVYTLSPYLFRGMHILTYIHAYIQIHKLIHTYIHTYIHTCRYNGHTKGRAAQAAAGVSEHHQHCVFERRQ